MFSIDLLIAIHIIRSLKNRKIPNCGINLSMYVDINGTKVNKYLRKYEKSCVFISKWADIYTYCY